MNSIIERVARAIAETGNGGVWTDETWYKEYQRDFHRKRACAAIEAMKLPTEEMLKAGTIYWDPADGSPIRAAFDPAKPYQAMISAALTDNQPA